MNNDLLTTPLCGIYGLRCRTTGKWYVGQSLEIPVRWNNAYKNLGCKNQTKIYNALLKYGYDDFDKIVLEGCNPDKAVLSGREDHWMKYYDSIDNGYNIREAGTSGRMPIESRIKMSASAKNKPPMTEETKKKLSSAGKGRIFDDATKKKISDAKKGKKLGPMSEEQKLSISAAQTGKVRPKLSEAMKRIWAERKLITT